MPETLEQFVATIEATELLSESQLQELRDSLSIGSQEPSIKNVVDDLTSRGLLTPYQASKLCDNQGESLIIAGLLVLDEIDVSQQWGFANQITAYRAQLPGTNDLVELVSISTQELPSSHHKELLRWFQVACEVDHGNVLQILHVAEDSSHIHIAYELLVGDSLDNLLESHGALPVELAMDCLQQLVAGLNALEVVKLPHPVLGLQHLVLDDQGCLKIRRLGIAQFIGLCRCERADFASEPNHGIQFVGYTLLAMLCGRNTWQMSQGEIAQACQEVRLIEQTPDWLVDLLLFTTESSQHHYRSIGQLAEDLSYAIEHGHLIEVNASEPGIVPSQLATAEQTETVHNINEIEPDSPASSTSPDETVLKAGVCVETEGEPPQEPALDDADEDRPAPLEMDVSDQISSPPSAPSTAKIVISAIVGLALLIGTILFFTWL